MIDPSIAGQCADLSRRNLDRERIGTVRRAKVDPHGFSLVHGQENPTTAAPGFGASHREVVQMPQRIPAQTGRQWIVVVVIRNAKGSLKLDRAVRLLVNLRKPELQHVVFEGETSILLLTTLHTTRFFKPLPHRNRWTDVRQWEVDDRPKRRVGAPPEFRKRLRRS